ncbi:MAG: hypothetical protein EHM17_04065 [Verrucomicrobiaceae bacterium]|nr:MAG: hypothetical protein EHM17_04065 [Verrucomicrobiaceae bacterium]
MSLAPFAIRNSPLGISPARAPAQAQRNFHHPDAHPSLRQQRQTPEVMKQPGLPTAMNHLEQLLSSYA